MIFAKHAIEQVDVDMSEDGKHVCAIGFTANDDDAAFASMPLRPECFDGDADLALAVTSEVLRAIVFAFGAKLP